MQTGATIIQEAMGAFGMDHLGPSPVTPVNFQNSIRNAEFPQQSLQVNLQKKTLTLVNLENSS
jgi:hypothetical protein